MLPGPCYVISDAHLGVASPEQEELLLSFLRHASEDAKSVVINGDLWDFWFEWTHAVPRAGVRVLGELARLRAAGIPVLFLAGNHDCWGGDVLRNDIGVDYRFEPWRGSLGGWDAMVEHGDGLRPVDDAPYRRLRTVLRHPLSKWLYRLLPPDVAVWLARRSSHTSRNYRPRDGGTGLRTIAHERLAAANAPKLMIFGHSHLKTLERAGNGVFANPGAWLDTPTFLRVVPERVELCRWTGTAREVEASIDAR